jgi:hypothetical protein
MRIRIQGLFPHLLKIKACCLHLYYKHIKNVNSFILNIALTLLYKGNARSGSEFDWLPGFEQDPH